MDVCVLAGGRSPEHDISLSSARQVLKHLDRATYRVWPVFLARDGAWWPAKAPLAADEAWRPGDPSTSHGPLRPGAALAWLLDHARIGCALPILHGPFGEDGTVQGMLELHDVPFVGSGCAASAVAMDKLRTRQTLAGAGIPIARAYVPRTPLAKADAELEFARMQQAIGAPAFVKGDLSGSTVGVQRIESAADLAAFFAAFRGTFRRWFAEEALVGEEITVPVLGNTGDELRPLLPVGIYPRTATWFTHEAKYKPGATEETVPPRGWGEPRIRHVQELAMRCHEALVCDGMSRTDMIVTKDGPHVLETNTIPGMTTTSLLPQSAAKCGLPFPKLLDTLIGHALARAGVVRPRPAPASTVTPGEAVADA